MTEIKLGQIVEDKASGFKGTVITRAEYISGTVQYVVQPRTTDEGKMPECCAIDYYSLTVIDDGISAELPPVDSTLTIKLGDKVRDKITNFEGIVASIHTHLNGCVMVNVLAPVNKEGKSIEYYADHKRFAVVPEKQVELPRASTGGPYVRGKPKAC